LVARPIDVPGVLEDFSHRREDGVVTRREIQDASGLNAFREDVVVKAARGGTSVAEVTPAARMLPAAKVDSPKKRTPTERTEDGRYAEGIRRLGQFLHSKILGKLSHPFPALSFR
jgi:hypothetical protein